MAENSAPDADQAHRKANRLRQRLVGAAVLIALAVLLLPIWLDGSGLRAPRVEPVPAPPEVAQPAKVEIPSPPPQQMKALENPPKQLMAPPPSVASAPTAAEKSPTTQHAAPQSGKPPAAPGDASPAKPENSSPAPDKSETAKPSAAKPTETPKPAADKSESIPKAVADGKWVVQLGSFSDELNARGLQKSVSEAGFKVYVEPLFAKKGTVWRVRVGPFATRDDANKATERLRERLGRDGLVMPQ